MQKPIGEHPAFLSTLEQASKLAATHKPVLIIGERGTGKELIAERLHYLSARWEAPYVTVHCGAFNENLIESELFGHEAGAFTDAKRRHAGRFERAENGSLFLDEIATAPLSTQQKLLRVIEYGEYERIGSERSLQTNVRIIAATHADLPKACEAGLFRHDLLDRLAFAVIHIPPLRARGQDIMLLANHFAVQMTIELGRSQFAGFTDRVIHELLAYTWPGNIRELKNVVERAVFLQADTEQTPIEQITLNPFAGHGEKSFDDQSEMQADKTSDRATSIGSTAIDQTDTDLTAVDLVAAQSKIIKADLSKPIDLGALTDDFKKALIEQALQHCQYHQAAAAKQLSLSYHQLRRLIKKYQL